MAGSAAKRTTIYFDQELYRTLRHKAVALDRSISDLINEAVRETLREDAEDLAAFEERAHEKSIPFEDAVRKLKARGKI